MTKGFEITTVFGYLMSTIEDIERIDGEREKLYSSDYNTSKVIEKAMNKRLDDTPIIKHMKTKRVEIHTSVGMYTIYFIGENGERLCEVTIDLDDLFEVRSDL